MENIKTNQNLINPELIKKLAKEAQDNVLDISGQPVKENKCCYEAGNDKVEVVKSNKPVDAVDELKEELDLELEKN